MQRRTLLSTAVGLQMAGAVPQSPAQGWRPSQPLRAIVPFAVGGGTDVVSRTLLPLVAELLGQPILIENKGGAGGTVGYAELARARPDGHTIGIAGTNLAYMSLLHPGLTFDPVADLLPVAPLAGVTLAVAADPNLPVLDLSGLVALAKAQDAPMAYATAGVSTPQHLAGELLARRLGVPLTHVPYKGTAPAVADVVGGHVPLIVIGLPSALPYVRAGQLRLLGVAAPTRSPLAPDLPTAAEAGLPGFEASFWYDVRVPKGTPAAVVDTLRAAVTRSVSGDAAQAALRQAGFEPMTADPAAYERALKADGDKWIDIVRRHGITGG